MVKRIHHRLSYILLAISALYILFGFSAIAAKRGLNYRPNPTAAVDLADSVKLDRARYVNAVDWLLDTSKNSLPLTANHVASYDPIDLKLAGVIFVVSLASLFVHKKMEVRSE
ncbi:hypothetical protein IT414_01510 [bacterium]|nr:hypothetical protein [bacterium]